MRKLVIAFEAAGVEFTNGDEPGVKLKKARRPATKPKKGDQLGEQRRRSMRRLGGWRRRPCR